MSTLYCLYELIFWSGLLFNLNLFYSVLLNHRLMRWTHIFRSLLLWGVSQLQCHIKCFIWTHFQHVYLPGRAVDCELRTGGLVSVHPRACQKVNDLSRPVSVCVSYIYLRTIRIYKCNVCFNNHLLTQTVLTIVYLNLVWLY